MTGTEDLISALRERIAAAHERGTPLAIRGGGTKAFLGHPVDGAFLDVSALTGIVDYQPGELVVTARAGTRLAELETVLAEQGQMLSFEPPHFGADATLGGTIAAGLSGPRRPWGGAARDLVLGTRVINGRGELLHFGGDVMKNVAGYDVSRLMAGAYGTLGVLVSISLKVLPRPAAETTLVQQLDATTAITRMNELAGKPWPLSGAYWEAGELYLRLSGAERAVDAARDAIGGDVDDDPDRWTRIRELQTPLTAGAEPLWRLSVPPAAPLADLPGDQALDWGGAQRWLVSDADPAPVRDAAEKAGGHATLFRGDHDARFHPLPDAMRKLHQRVKQSLDPAGILNPGRLYPWLDSAR